MIPSIPKSRWLGVISEIKRNNANGDIKNHAGEETPPGLKLRTEKKPELVRDKPGSTKPRIG